MTDMFDTLAARALGTEVPLRPIRLATFAAPTHERRLVIAPTPDEAQTPAHGRIDEPGVVARPARATADREARRAKTGSVTQRHDIVPAEDGPGRRVPDPVPWLDAEVNPHNGPKPAPVAPPPDEGPARRRTVRLDLPAPPDRGADRAALSAPPPVPEPATRRDARSPAPNHGLAPAEEFATARVDVSSAEASATPATTPTRAEVTVHIGSVVVRSAPVPAGPSPRPPTDRPQPRMSLQEYLRQGAKS